MTKCETPLVVDSSDGGAGCTGGGAPSRGAVSTPSPGGLHIKHIDSLPILPYLGRHGEERCSHGSNGALSNQGVSPRRPSDERVHFETGLCQNYVPLHDRLKRRVQSGTPFFSLEFFPPKTANGVANFFTRLERLQEGDPLFVDITWHMASDPANLEKETSSTSIATGCLNYCRVETMLHVTCVQYTREQTIAHLNQAKRIGLRNILALRGDMTTSDEQKTNRYCALDMIRWMKEEYNDYFTIACSGYPTGHPEAASYKDDLLYLKQKVDAGAHFIITQLFFEAEVFERFVRDCREIGITVPIIPGIMPIQSYQSLRRIAEISKLTIPQKMIDDLEAVKDDDEAVRKYFVHSSIEMCRRLLSAENGIDGRVPYAPSIHLYTMNREGAVREILQVLGLWPEQRPPRALPWEPHGGRHPLRCKEDVRPIFWSGRPKSYIYRTRDWDEFPNGRWGNASSPAFNDLKEYYLFLKGEKNHEDQLAMYGRSLESMDDVRRVFCNYISQEENENGRVVKTLPWNEAESGWQSETELIKEQLLWANSNGILTINSQPNVNAAPSTDPLVGWGKPGGYCYQKAYVECFVNPDLAKALLSFIDSYAPRINYHIINHDASVDATNNESTTPIAVTWGVFPGAEIAQPTIVDPLSFRVWKDEAYDMWVSQWASLYPPDSKSRAVIQHIHDSYLLLTLVDNDFPRPSIIFELLERALSQSQEASTTTASSAVV